MNPPTPEPSRWKKGGRRTLASTRILDLNSVQFRHPVRGTEREFVIVDAPDWVNVIALTPEGHLVLVHQFRYGIDAFSLEVPGGVIERGEDPVAAGQRELREETGYVGASARLLGSVHPNPAIQSNRCHLVLVEAARRAGPPAWDHDEEIAVSTAPVEEVFAWARSGRITHALVLDALWLFEPFWERSRKGPGV
ncbi:MAG TPA: NUDIX hydrolase [Opitutaceae bacterium]|nr:NUDIX hydrolase [Opitutaceae bacterium]